MLLMIIIIIIYCGAGNFTPGVWIFGLVQLLKVTNQPQNTSHSWFESCWSMPGFTGRYCSVGLVVLSFHSYVHGKLFMLCQHASQ